MALSKGLDSMEIIDIMLVIYTLSAIGSILTCGFYLYKEGLTKQCIKITKTLPSKAYITIIAGSVTVILCHGLFILSLTMVNKAGASLLYESWPIIAVIATPFFMKKKWKSVSLKEFLVSLCALAGVAIIVLSDKNINISFSQPTIIDNFDYIHLLGYVVAFIGAYMCALAVVTKGMICEHYNEINDDICSSLISEVFTRILSMIIILITFFVIDNNFKIENIEWYSSFYVGFVVMVVGGTLYTYTLLKTESPTIHIMYYFVPVLAVIWLWIAGESEINAGLFIGGAIIVACNLYLFIAGRNAPLSEDL